MAVYSDLKGTTYKESSDEKTREGERWWGVTVVLGCRFGLEITDCTMYQLGMAMWHISPVNTPSARPTMNSLVKTEEESSDVAPCSSSAYPRTRPLYTFGLSLPPSPNLPPSRLSIPPKAYQVQLADRRGTRSL